MSSTKSMGRSKLAALVLATGLGLVAAVVVGVLAEVTGNLSRGASVSEAGGPWFALAFVVGAWTRSWRVPVVLAGAVLVAVALAVNIGYRAAVHGPDAVDHFIRYLAPLWFPFALGVGAVFAAAGVAGHSRHEQWAAVGGGLFLAGLLLDAVVSWQRFGGPGLAVAVVNLVIALVAGIPFVRRVDPRWLTVAVIGWTVVGATAGVLAYDRVLGGIDQGPDDVTIHDG